MHENLKKDHKKRKRNKKELKDLLKDISIEILSFFWIKNDARFDCALSNKACFGLSFVV